MLDLNIFRSTRFFFSVKYCRLLLLLTLFYGHLLADVASSLVCPVQCLFYIWTNKLIDWLIDWSFSSLLAHIHDIRLHGVALSHWTKAQHLRGPAHSWHVFQYFSSFPVLHLPEAAKAALLWWHLVRLSLIDLSHYKHHRRHYWHHDDVTKSLAATAAKCLATRDDHLSGFSSFKHCFRHSAKLSRCCFRRFNGDTDIILSYASDHCPFSACHATNVTRLNAFYRLTLATRWRHVADIDVAESNNCRNYRHCYEMRMSEESFVLHWTHNR